MQALIFSAGLVICSQSVTSLARGGPRPAWHDKRKNPVPEQRQQGLKRRA